MNDIFKQYEELFEDMSNLASKLIPICKKHSREEFIPFLEKFLDFPNKNLSLETIVEFNVELESYKYILQMIGSSTKTLLRKDMLEFLELAHLCGEDAREWDIVKKNASFSLEFCQCVRITLEEKYGNDENSLNELLSPSLN